MSEPSLDIELFHYLAIIAFDLLTLIRGVPQLPPLLESNWFLPDLLYFYYFPDHIVFWCVGTRSR